MGGKPDPRKAGGTTVRQATPEYLEKARKRFAQGYESKSGISSVGGPKYENTSKDVSQMGIMKKETLEGIIKGDFPDRVKDMARVQLAVRELSRGVKLPLHQLHDLVNSPHVDGLIKKEVALQLVERNIGVYGRYAKSVQGQIDAKRAALKKGDT